MQGVVCGGDMSNAREMRSARLILVAGLAMALAGASAQAQDSVSTTSGLPGDALSAYTTGASGNQRKDYGVDLQTKVTSWGSRYYIGPVSKASLSSYTGAPNFFNHLVATAALSNTISPLGAYPRATYQAWQAAGQGVNTLRNSVPTDDGTGAFGIVDLTSNQGQTMGFAMLEFGGGNNTTFGDNEDENNIIAGLITMTPRVNKRVYVSRLVAATNRPSASAALTSNSSLGLGGVDETGKVVFLGDGFNVSSGDNPLTNRRLYRVDTALRNIAQVNQIASSGPVDTTATRTLLSTTTNQTTPTLIPTGVAGRPVLLGADMANNLLSEVNANTITLATTHLASGVSARGPIAFTAFTSALTSNGTADAGTCAVLARGPSATKTRNIAVWGMNTGGTSENPLRFELPLLNTLLVDPVDGFAPSSVHGSLGNHEFMNYQSQVCFRGGNGPVALTVLPTSGDLLLAAGVAATGGGSSVPQSMDNYIAVCRVTPAGVATWTIAAHTGGPNGAAGSSKAILGRDENQNLVPIGELAKYNEVYPGSTSGPSISAPSMDKLGNLYFMATIQLNTLPQPTRTAALLRANFDRDTNGYQLEIITKVGDVIAGPNSTRNYQIQFLSPADADSVDSGGTWHSSMCQQLTYAGQITEGAAEITYGSEFSLGALLFRTKIVYDINNDGIFLDPTTPPGAGSPDQAYNAAMLMLPPFNGVDIAGAGGLLLPDGSVDGEDFIAFLNAFGAGDPVADLFSITQYFPDGNIDGDDFVNFLNAFAAGG